MHMHVHVCVHVCVYVCVCLCATGKIIGKIHMLCAYTYIFLKNMWFIRYFAYVLWRVSEKNGLSSNSL